MISRLCPCLISYDMVAVCVHIAYIFFQLKFARRLLECFCHLIESRRTNLSKVCQTVCYYNVTSISFKISNSNVAYKLEEIHFN